MYAFQLWLSNIGSFYVTGMMLACICLYLFYTGKQKDFDRIFFTTFIAMGTTFAIKYMTNVPRPLEALISESDSRFPSGHATIAAVVASLGVYYVHAYVKHERVRKILYTLCALWFMLVSYSRLYLHVHVFVDVFVGGLIGVGASVFVWKLFKHLRFYK